MSASDPSAIFAHRPSKAKATQKFFFWWFRLSTYFILAAASYLFLKITIEGSITVFRSSFPFVNTRFFTQSPQTLYVFPWDDAELTEEKQSAVAAVEAEIRDEIAEAESSFPDKLAQAQEAEAENRNALHAVDKEIRHLKKEVEGLEKKVEAATKKIVKLDRLQQRLFDRNADQETLAAKRGEILKALEARQQIFTEKAAVEKSLAEAATEKNRLSAALPDRVQKEHEEKLAGLKASLEWPAPGYFEEQNQAEARIQEKFDAEIAALEKKYRPRIERQSDLLKQKKLTDRLKDKIAKVESERELALEKARSFEAGDQEYRAVYARKVEAAGMKAKTYSYSGGGIFPAIAGTVLLTLGSMTIALVLGIFSAIYLSEYAKPGKFLNLIRLSILNLAGVPSIVFGLFGLGMFVLFFDWNVSLLAGCFTLAFMVLPVIITASEESLRAIPQGFREGSLALGATKWTSIRTNVLPYALPGILTSSVLGVARVAGETAPIMFTAAYALRDNLPWEGLDNPLDFFFQGVMALPYHIYVVSSKIPQNAYTERMQYGTAFVFLVIVAGIALSSILLRIRMRKKYKW
ncbi:MAG: phosphate ABC transporter permease PstA [Kiritimatiellia bacterium]